MRWTRSKAPLKGWKKVAAQLLFAAGVVGLVGLSAHWGKQSADLVLHGERAIATCTRIERRRLRHGSPRQSVVYHVSFATDEGALRQATVNGAMSGLREGGTIEVLYDPLQYDRVQADTFVALWLLPLLPGVAAMGAVASAWAAARRRRRRRAERQTPLAGAAAP